MNMIVSLLSILLIGGYVYAWVIMVIHALTRPIPHRILWLAVLIFVPVLGVLGYYFAFYFGKFAVKPLNKSALVAVAATLIGLGALSAILIPFTTNSRSHLTEVPLDEVIRQANNGEVHRIVVKGDELTIVKKDDTEPTEWSRKKSDSSLYQQGLTNKQVEIDVITK